MYFPISFQLSDWTTTDWPSSLFANMDCKKHGFAFLGNSLKNWDAILCQTIYLMQMVQQYCWDLKTTFVKIKVQSSCDGTTNDRTTESRFRHHRNQNKICIQFLFFKLGKVLSREKLKTCCQTSLSELLDESIWNDRPRLFLVSQQGTFSLSFLLSKFR